MALLLVLGSGPDLQAKSACIFYFGIVLFLFVNLIEIPPIIKRAPISAYITDTFKEAGMGGRAFILAGAKPGSV